MGSCAALDSFFLLECSWLKNESTTTLYAILLHLKVRRVRLKLKLITSKIYLYEVVVE
jgi:hypothetical protein